MTITTKSFCRENYPYFRAEDERWKNSVRHNLSMNPHFRKGTKSKNGHGHVWVLATETGTGAGGPGHLVSVMSRDQSCQHHDNIIIFHVLTIGRVSASQVNQQRTRSSGSSQENFE